MHDVTCPLEAALRQAVARHVRAIEQDELLRDVEEERRRRAARSGERAGDDYVRRVIVSLQSDADE